MDGRVQEPVCAWMRNRFGVDYVDTITEAGPVKILAENADDTAVQSIRRRVDISVGKHGSRVVALVAHHDCAGNPVDKEQQMQQLTLGIDTIVDWGFHVDVLGLWVDEDWRVHPVGFD